MEKRSPLYISPKPEDGCTVEQPFAAGTGGSEHFRIPGIITLKDGRLIAVCDARWDHDGDGAGLDTMASVSGDGGKTWRYTFANYLGDNGNSYHDLSSSFIDPAIATDGKKAYLIADLFPAGIALNTSRYQPIAGQNGLDQRGNLRLRRLEKDRIAIGEEGYAEAAAQAEYDCYLDLSGGSIRRYADGGREEDWQVDAYFRIKGEDGSTTNLFCSDSPFQPYPTNYLYLTTTEDGRNWSAPKLLNAKREQEQTLLVGPGNGCYDAQNQRLIFTAYEFTSGYQRSCLLWMDAQETWHRTAPATGENWSSEATAVVLSDDTVRCFYRDAFPTLRYTDYRWSPEQGNYLPGEETDTGLPKTWGNQLSALHYSKEVGGREMILLSTACDEGRSRRKGRIYCLAVREDRSLELLSTYAVTEGKFAYSCLTELDNGDIALLYEQDDAAITFLTIPKENILPQ